MSTIPSASSANASSTASAISSTGLLGSVGKQDLQNEFLNLLVAELKNQDPTNPLSNDQMISQMAQISSVSSINSIQQSIASLSTGLQSSQALQAASMIGHNVLAPGSSTELSNNKSVFGVDLSAPADSVKVTIKDANGNTVHSMDLGVQNAGVIPLQWDGVTDTGAAAADGTYSFGISATSAGKPVQATGLAFGALQSVSTGAGGVNVSVAGVGNVALSDLRQIL
ncbi:MAG: flagellar hook assembly protein FlgD [Proteobacteria bacterium]|nr:flagellar hook assembly protein FlgD [Pseudomonadota bacterium]